MTAGDGPVVVAYDGSAEARAALEAAAKLFAGRPHVIVSVWEPGLAAAFAAAPDPTGLSQLPPSPEQMAAVDEAQRWHAQDAADTGAELARSLGVDAEAIPVPDDADVAETVASVAAERDACAVVVGSRGLGGIKARLLGSTSQGMLKHARCPVVVVKLRE